MTQEQIQKINDYVASHIQCWKNDRCIYWLNEDGNVVANYGSYTPFTDITQAMELAHKMATDEDHYITICLEGHSGSWALFSNNLPVFCETDHYGFPTLQGLATAITTACLQACNFDIMEIIK